jgi:N-acetylglucosamine kinase-like BadF-type ATPase
MVILDQGKLPPSNLRLTTPERLREILCRVAKRGRSRGSFLAGCGTEEDRQSLALICRDIWPNAKIVTGSDRDSGLAAALDHGDGIAVNAGSGSSVTGRRGDRIERAGGWGHILGDTGGGYFLSIEALRLILREYDLHRGEMQFTAKILHALSLNTLDELVRWVQTADKMEIAMLAPVVFEAAVDGDPCVIEIVEEGARVLCEYTEAVASRLHLLAPKVVLMGGPLSPRLDLHARVSTQTQKESARRPRDRCRAASRIRRRMACSERKVITLLFNQSSLEGYRRFGCRAYRTAQSALGEPGKDERATTGRTFCRRRKICGGCVAWSNQGPCSSD